MEALALTGYQMYLHINQHQLEEEELGSKHLHSQFCLMVQSGGKPHPQEDQWSFSKVVESTGGPARAR